MRFYIFSIALLFSTFSMQAQPHLIQVKDICTGACASYPATFYEFNGRLYFSANDDVHGNELWSTDGTAAGTHIVADIEPGNTSRAVNTMFGFDGTLYFSGHNPVSPYDWNFYKTDGSAAGTQIIDSRYLLEPCANIGSSKFVFTASKVPYPYVSTLFSISAGSSQINEIEDIDLDLLTPVGNKAVGISSGNNKLQLWVTDGTLAGTKSLKDVGVKVSQAYVFYGKRDNNTFTPWGNRLLFTGDSTAGNRYTLWVTDGTEAGTKTVFGNAPSRGPLNAELTTVCNGKIFFSAALGSLPILWITDGTTAGTQPLTDPMLNGIKGAYMRDFCIMNNKVHFMSGADLWASDGTKAGTQIVIPNLPAKSDKFVANGGYIYFFTRDTAYPHDTHVYRIDEQYNLTKSVAAFSPDADEVSMPLTIYKGHIFFTAAAANTPLDYELWTIDDFPSGIPVVNKKATTWVYPNPVASTFSIQPGNALIKVFSLTGQLLLQTTETQNINIQYFPAGMYQVQITTNGQTHIEKLIKE